MSGIKYLLDSCFILEFHKISIDIAIENAVIELRKRHKIKLPDAIVLAAALTHKLQLLSLGMGLMNKYQKHITSQ